MSIIKDFIVKSGLLVQGTSSTVSTGSGALQVQGGAGIAGSVYAGGIATLGAVNPGTGSTSSAGVQTLRVTSGGAGVIGDSYINGQLRVNGNTFITDSTAAVSTNSGALTIGNGGLGVGGAAYFGQPSYVEGSQIVTAATLGNYGVASLTAGTDTVITTSTGAITIWNVSTLQTITNRGAVTTNAITVNNSTAATTTATGALIIQNGGLGVGGNIIAGGRVSVGATLTITGITTVLDTTDSTSVTSGALQVAGGLGVAKNLTALTGVITSANSSTSVVSSNAFAITSGGLGVAGSARIEGVVVLSNSTNGTTTSSGQALLVSGGVGVGQNLVATQVITKGTTAATTLGAGSLQVAGGAYIANNVVIAGTGASTGTTSSNALYVVGGVGIDGSLMVGGPVTFASPVTFNGTATYVLSTNTWYTDNLLDLHTPPTGVQGNWAVDDGKDIGIRFRYFKNSTDTTAALILANDSKLLEWYDSGVESLTTGTVTGGQYGGFKLGYLWASSSTQATSTNTGAIRVDGGIGAWGNLFLGGNGQTASSSTVDSQAIRVDAGGIGIVGVSYFQDGLGVGGAGIAATGVSATGGTGSASAVGTQGLRSANGLGVTGDSYLNGALQISGITTVTNTTNALGTNTGALQVVGGVGIGQDLQVGGTIYGNLTGVATTATNLQKGNAGEIPIQNNAGVTTFIPAGALGYVLTAASGNTATWQAISSLPAGTATNALNIAVTGTNAASPYYFGIVESINPTGYYEPVYSTATMSLVPSTGVLSLSGTTESTTSTNGTLVVSGGAGFAKSVNIWGTLTNVGPHLIYNGTEATSSSTGALIVSGGASVTKSLVVFGTSTFVNTLTNTAIAGTNGAIVYVNTNGTLNTSSNFTFIANTLTSPNVLVNSGALATSTSTGALRVVGGVGISGSTYIGGNLYVQGTSTLFSSFGVLYGDVWGFGALYAGVSGYTPLPQVVTQYGANTSTYAQLNFQNINSGTQASADIVITADNGNDSSHFIDLGIASSNYNYPGYELYQANDGYLLLDGGNLLLGTQTAGKKVKIFAGSTTATGAVATFSAGGTQSTTTNTGVLTLVGGLGVWANANIGGTLTRSGSVSATAWGTSGVGITAPGATYTDSNSSGAVAAATIHSLGQPTIAASGGTITAITDAATLYIAGAPTAGTGVSSITNAWALQVAGGNVKIAANTTNNSPTTGALVVTGGVGIGGNLTAAGYVQAGTAATGSAVNAFQSNNLLLSSYTSSAINTTATVNLDVWSTSTYRSARYSIQLVDTGFTPNRIHYTEMVLIHDGNASVYKSEYGVIANVGELGTFDATVTISGVQLTFTPSWPTLTPGTLTVKSVRTTIN